jgi:organic radical activating enzyme
MKHIRTENNFIEDYILVDYEMYTLCDKNCTYCYNVIDTDGVRFNRPADEIIRVLKRILDMNNKKVIIQLIGGEVMLHKHFEEIISFILEYKHEDHKLLLFTHADHPINFFEERINLLKKFGDKVKISCTLHLQDLNKERFLHNIKLIQENFTYSNLMFFTDPEYLKDIDFVMSTFESLTTMKLYPLMLDHSNKATTLYQLVKMNSNFDRFADKMDVQYVIDGIDVPVNRGKFQLHTKTQLQFTGCKCKIRDYEVDKEGNLVMSCFEKGQTPITNIFQNPSKKLLDGRTIECKQVMCNPNLVSFEIEFLDDK